jgi:hypothetical protein
MAFFLDESALDAMADAGTAKPATVSCLADGWAAEQPRAVSRITSPC